MKKTLFIGLVLAASAQMFGASAQDLLKEARNDYYKNLNKKTEPVKVKREKVVKDAQKAIDEARKEMSDGTVDEYLDQKEEAPKPKTPMERLQYNSEKAADKVDFYERVVRSVKREEAEVVGYNDVLGKQSSKKVDSRRASQKPKKVVKKSNKK